MVWFSLGIYLTSTGWDGKHTLRFIDSTAGVIAGYNSLLLGIV